MGFQFVGFFIDSFMDDVAYVRDVEVCMQSMICYLRIVRIILIQIILIICRIPSV